MSGGRSQQPAPSIGEFPPTSREEIVTLLERTTAEVISLRALHEQYTKRVEDLEALVTEQRESGRLVDQAYLEANKEIVNLRVALGGVQQQLAIAEARAKDLQQELAKTRKERDAARHREKVAMVIGLAALVLRLVF